MEQKKVLKYVAFYDTPLNEKENREYSLAAVNKIDYICSVLVKKKYSVEVISPSWTNNSKGVYKGTTREIADKVTLRTFFTFGAKSKVLKKIRYYISIVQMLVYLLINSEKDENILVYHSVALITPLKIIKAIKKCKIVLEVEEVYSDVWRNNTDKRMNKEIEFVRKADKYIFVSDLLKKKFSDKNAIVLYGSYEVKKPKQKSNDNRYINLVYAGSVDSTKGGALNSVKSLNYLGNNYRLFILGHGKNKDIAKVKEAVADINNLKGYECATYYESMTGIEFDKIMFNCDIGLNPQYEGEYMNTAFPSKILTYLKYNLKVVSTRIESILSSQVSHLIDFSKEDSSIEIAKAIKNTNLNDEYDTSSIIYKLDKSFSNEIELLLEQ